MSKITGSEMKSKVFKSCGVPQCTNSSIKTPDKLFVYVPNKKTARESWLRIAGRDPTNVSTRSPIYFCEDHFDLPNDMVNYMQYHVMGHVSQVRMHPGCVPTKFACQPDRDTADKEFVYEVEFENGPENLNGKPSRIKMERPETPDNTNVQVKVEFENKQEVTVKIEPIESDEYSSEVFIKDEFVKEEPIVTEVDAVSSPNLEDKPIKSEFSQIKNNVDVKIEVTDQKITDQKITDQKTTGQKNSDQKITDQKITDQKTTGQKNSDQKITGQKIIRQKLTCKQCGINFTNKDKSAFIILLLCDFCKIQAKREAANKNISQRWYGCNLCSKYFSCKSTLITHMNLHAGGKKYICHLCNKAVSHRSTLKTHLQLHTGERPFPCNICNKAFRQRSNLRKHIVTHTGEKKFPCDKCDVRCVTKYSLMRHKNVHAENENKQTIKKQKGR